MKNISKKILALIIVALLAFLPGTAGLASGIDEVDETVYALLSPEGLLKNLETIVRVESDKQQFKYYGEFSEIDMLTLGTKFEYDDQTLLWEKDKSGNDLYFKVVSDKQLPIEIDIKHYLEGEEISTKEAAGRKGRYRMEFSIKPNPKANQKIVEKYMSQIQLQVDMEKARNIDCPDATKVIVGKYLQLAWTAMPLAEVNTYIEYDTNKLETGELTITMVDYSDSIPDEFGELAIGFDEVNGGMVMVSEAIGQLTKGMTQGVSGLTELEKGMSEMAGGAVDFSKGLKSYGTGLSEFVNAVSGVNTGLSEAAQGLSQISQNSDVLYEGYVGLENGYVQVSENINMITAMAEEFAQSGDEKATQLYMGLQGIIQAMGQLNEGMAESNAGYAGLSEGLNEVTIGVNQISGGLGEIAKEGKSVVGGYKMIEGGAEQLLSALDPATKGLKEAAGGFSEIEGGLYKIHESHITLTDAVSQMNTEISAMISGETEIVSFNDLKNEVKSLQFFINIEGIEIEEQIEEKIEVDEKNFWENLWDRIKALFKSED